MTSEALTNPNAAGESATSRPTVRHAGRVLLVAGALGVLGQLLFFGVGLGINYPIAIALLIGGAWLVRREPRVGLRDAWLGPAAIGFASFAAVRSDPGLVALDGLTALALAGGALASFGGRQVVTRSFGGLLGLAASAIGWGTAGAIPAISDAHVVVPSPTAASRAAGPFLPVLRGLAIATPVLLVFVALFASADAVFAEIVDGLVQFELNVGDIGWRAALGIVLAWLAAGGLSLAATSSRSDTQARPTTTRMIGSTELVTVLASVNLLFVVFVALQAAYLFGGLDTLAATGLTYAEYARRGFFELVAVALLAGGLIVIAEQFARRRTRILLVAAVGLAIQAGVVLASAALRLRLYQEAYGWTELRLYVLATIIVLGVGLVALVAAVSTNRVPWIGHVLIVASLVVGALLNVIGPVRFITEQNVARIIDPALVPPHGSSGLDIEYASGLGDDAVPTLLRALPSLDPGDERYLGEQLASRLDVMRGDRELNAWQAWNLGRSTARDALEAARADGSIP